MDKRDNTAMTRAETAIEALKQAAEELDNAKTAKHYHHKIMGERVYIGIVPAVFLKLLDLSASQAGLKNQTFTPDEMMVIDAIRRSDNDLAEAEIKEISAHLREYSPEQLRGIENNVKGIYHEMKVAAAENADGDNMEAELYEVTNHPGADVRLINTATGEVTDIQLKATDSTHYVASHQERYPDTEVMATQEVADNLPGVESSGFSNADLTEDVSGTFDKLTDPSTMAEAGDSYVEASAVTGGLISAVLNTKAVLEGKQSASTATRKTLEDAAAVGVSALILDVLIGS